MDEEMKVLVSRFAEYLKMFKQQLQCFHKCESQVEGWFKGELLCFLDQEKLGGRLPNFEQEKKLYVGVKRNRVNVDIMLQFDQPGGQLVSKWVELKHWIGHQNNRDWTPSSYFLVPPKRSDSCAQCVERLLKIPEDGDKFILVAFTPKPGSKDWNAGVRDFNTKFSPLAVRSLTNPDDYPEYFFVGLLYVPEVASTDVPRFYSSASVRRC